MTTNKKTIYAIKSAHNRDFILKTTDKEGVYKCVDLMNELHPGELGVNKFKVVIAYKTDD